MRRKYPASPVSAAAVFAFTYCLAGLEAADPHRVHTFERTQLTGAFLCEGATFGDVSGDGVNDVIAGPFWYKGPDFKERHEYYPPKTFDVKGYSDNFFAFLHDFNGDKALDIFIIGFPGADASWFENPRGAEGHWKRHIVFDSVDNESPTFTDITGDGRPEIVCQTGGRFGYASFDPRDPAGKWPFTPIGEKRDLGRFTHGLGVGDVNGDRRLDVLEKDGWYEQPASLAQNPLWKYHAYPFAPGVGGAQMYAYDLDGDGDSDVITSQNAHGWGLVWHEQVRKDGEIAFVEHRIMGKTPAESDGGVAFAQLHAIELVDMDGDGLKDIVTGLRVWAHHGEPTAEPPGLSYWFKLRRGAGGEVSFLPYLIDNASGVGTQVVVGDIDKDGLPDLVVGNKLGTFVLKHRVKEVSREDWRRAQPRGMAKSGLTPSEAADHMTVPEGFQVDLVAGEPDLNQPIAFTFDERGRIWVAEAYTYPARVKGKEGRWDEGEDRIVIFEDADGDGRFESRKVFAEHINLVSGLEVGHGGVWVGAAPYLLFFPDKNRDDHPDGAPEIVLDGFGLEDTHETLNAFNWGPDGWLYGCHGIFTHSLVGKPGTPDKDRTPLNAGVWRFHPTRRVFEVFAWGTSNPWGVDFNDVGEAFVTACVIPHLYHVIQGARYERQAGAHFDPHAYGEIRTIADHAHYTGNIADHAWWGHEPVAPQATLDAGGGHAHCGAMIYLGDAFPAQYRGALFMCNIHGNRVNTDVLEARGSGYVGHHGKDFLLANDRWFRGINLKYGPDGSVYLIDWYDKNACHRAQPEIWDRKSGRLYRVSTLASSAPVAGLARKRVDLSSSSSLELAQLCLHPNDWYVRMARRQLAERGADEPARIELLSVLRTNAAVDRKLRALWALHAIRATDESLLTECLGMKEEHVRAWAVRLASDSGSVSRGLLGRFADLAARDPSPVVRLRLASALQRIPVEDRLPIARGLASHAEDAEDRNIPLLLWYGIEPLAATTPAAALELAASARIPLVSRFIFRRVASRIDDLEPILAHLLRPETDARPVLEEMQTAFEGQARLKMPASWQQAYERLVKSPDPGLQGILERLAVKFGDRRIFPRLRASLADRKAPLADRERSLSVLLDGKDPELAPALTALLDEPELRSKAIKALAAYDGEGVPQAMISRYASLTADERADVLSTLASRRPWGLELLKAVGDGRVPRKDLGAFTIRQLRALGDRTITAAIEESWGNARETSEEKRKEIARLKETLTPARLETADLRSGRAVFSKTCATCHTLFGAGGKIGPDITGSNRANLDYVLENILDPSAVVGKDYLMSVLALRDGRVVSGLVLRESETAFTVRTINEEVIVAKDEVADRTGSELSLMPEGQLKTLSPDETRDLVAYLASPVQVLLPAPSVLIDPATKRAAGVIEGESLKILKVSHGSAAPQEMSAFGQGKWSSSHQLWWTGGNPGDRLELELPVSKAATYSVEGALTMAPDYGVLQLWLDGQKLQTPIDLYSPRVITTGNALLGEAHLDAGKHVLAVEVVGANLQAARAFMFGLDYVRLVEKG